jgi:hypothetical protein
MFIGSQNRRLFLTAEQEVFRQSAKYYRKNTVIFLVQVFQARDITCASKHSEFRNSFFRKSSAHCELGPTLAALASS